jgi:integrase
MKREDESLLSGSRDHRRKANPGCESRRLRVLSASSVIGSIPTVNRILMAKIRICWPKHGLMTLLEPFGAWKTKGRYFTHEEEGLLMTTMTGTLSHLRPIAIVGIGTGLRPPSEIFNLRRSDVDFERNVLRAGTKTDEGREIPMNKDVHMVLLELYKRETGSDYLFVRWTEGSVPPSKLSGR